MYIEVQIKGEKQERKNALKERKEGEMKEKEKKQTKLYKFTE